MRYKDFGQFAKQSNFLQTLKMLDLYITRFKGAVVCEQKIGGQSASQNCRAALIKSLGIPNAILIKIITQ